MAVQVAHAQVIAYDHFDYTAGSQLWGGTQVAGAQEGIGGVGWGSTWSATSAAIATNFGTGLVYGGLPTSGGGVVMGVPGGPTATTASAQRLSQIPWGLWQLRALERFGSVSSPRIGGPTPAGSPVIVRPSWRCSQVRLWPQMAARMLTAARGWLSAPPIPIAPGRVIALTLSR